MYKKQDKQAAFTALSHALQQYAPFSQGQKTGGRNEVKKADSETASVSILDTDKPTYAGEVTKELTPKQEEPVLNTKKTPEQAPVTPSSPLMKKLSVVLSKRVRQAAQQGQYAPNNVGVRYNQPGSTPAQAPMNPLPVGAQPQQAQQAQQQNPAAYQGALAGPGAISPSSNPINNYGPISASGDINGNAAFGMKNSPDSSKTAMDWQSALLQGGTIAAAGLLPAALYAYEQAKKQKNFAAQQKALQRLKAIGAIPRDDKRYSLPKGAVFESPYATVDMYDGQLGMPEGYEYLGYDDDDNPVLNDPEKKLVSMFHETGDLQRIRLPDSSKTAGSPAWQRAEGKNDEGGLNAKGRASYNKATGGNLKAPVTESNPSGERAKRQNSFCARMCGMKSKETGSKTKQDPDSRINKSLRKWNCKCGSAYEFGQMLAGKEAGSISTILDNDKKVHEAKEVQDVEPQVEGSGNEADMDPTDATNKSAARGDMAKKYLTKDEYLNKHTKKPEDQKTMARELRRVRSWPAYKNTQEPTGDTPVGTVRKDMRGAERSMYQKPKSGPTPAWSDVPARESKKKQANVALDIFFKQAKRLSWGGQRWQLGQAGINPQVGYRYLAGVVPSPQVGLRLGLPGAGVSVGLSPFPYLQTDFGEPSGRFADTPRSLWKYMADGGRSPEDAFFLELAGIEAGAPVERYQKLLRDRAIGSSTEEINAIAQALSESEDVRRMALTKRLPAGVNKLLPQFNAKNPKSLYATPKGQQPSLAQKIVDYQHGKLKERKQKETKKPTPASGKPAEKQAIIGWKKTNPADIASRFTEIDPATNDMSETNLYLPAMRTAQPRLLNSLFGASNRNDYDGIRWALDYHGIDHPVERASVGGEALKMFRPKAYKDVPGLPAGVMRLEDADKAREAGREVDMFEGWLSEKAPAKKKPKPKAKAKSKTDAPSKK